MLRHHPADASLIILIAKWQHCLLNVKIFQFIDDGKQCSLLSANHKSQNYISIPCVLYQKNEISPTIRYRFYLALSFCHEFYDRNIYGVHIFVAFNEIVGLIQFNCSLKWFRMKKKSMVSGTDAYFMFFTWLKLKSSLWHDGCFMRQHHSLHSKTQSIVRYLF